MVHSDEDLEIAQKATQILFGKSTTEDLKALEARTLLEIFEGVPQARIPRDLIQQGMDMIQVLAGATQFLKSNGEARRALKENSISVNKEKVSEEFQLTSAHLLADQFILLQRGKKNYYLVVVED